MLRLAARRLAGGAVRLTAGCGAVRSPLACGSPLGRSTTPCAAAEALRQPRRGAAAAAGGRDLARAFAAPHDGAPPPRRGRPPKQQQPQEPVAGARVSRADRYAAVPSIRDAAAPRRRGRPPKQAPQQEQPQQRTEEQWPGSEHVPDLAPVEPSVLESRRLMVRRLPVQQYRVVGVSFDNRQALIPQLEPGQALALVREPDNPHDANAVAVRTLDDQSVGHIGRDYTQHFRQDLCFGSVASLGQQGEGGLWGLSVSACRYAARSTLALACLHTGCLCTAPSLHQQSLSSAACVSAIAQVAVEPSLPPVEVLAFPASLRPHVCLGLALAPTGGDAWGHLKEQTLAASQGRCAVTGGPLAAVHERWRFDDGERVLRLVGFRAEAPEVQQVGGLLELEGEAAHEAAELLRELNGWSAADAQRYLSHQRRLRQQRSAHAWRLDLDLLALHGVPVPPALQPLCV